MLCNYIPQERLKWEITWKKFQEIVKLTFTTQPTTSVCIINLGLDYIESSILRYVAGYVIRHLRKRIEGGLHPLRKQLLLFLTELCEKSGIDDEVEDGTLSETSPSEEWINGIDRGRLVHVTCNTYIFIYAMEMKTRQHFSMSHASTIVADSKMALLQAILRDESEIDYYQIISEE